VLIVILLSQIILYARLTVQLKTQMMQKAKSLFQLGLFCDSDIAYYQIFQQEIEIFRKKCIVAFRLCVCFKTVAKSFFLPNGLTTGAKNCTFDAINFQTMRKIIVLFFICAAVLKAYPQWTLLSGDFEPNISVTAFDSTVISGATSFGPFDMAVSYNNGVSWAGSNLFQSNGIVHLITGDSLIYASTPNGVYRSVKDNLNWSAYNEGLPNGQIRKICLKDSVILAAGNSSIYKRLAGDNIWTTICESSPVGGIHDFDFDGNRIVVAGNGIAESVDMGLSWTLWPPAYAFEWNAVTIKGDTIIAASKGGVYRKRISNGNISNVSTGLIELWTPYGGGYFGEFEMFLRIGNNLFLCGETGVYKLSENSWFWEHTGLGSWTYALAFNDEMLFAVKGYGGIWGRPINQLIINTNEITADQSSVSLYPNPTTDIIAIDTECADGKRINLVIINLNGQQLFQCQITDSMTVVDVSAFPKGIYFVKITDDTRVKTAKFVKQ
jgi:hypothetical protein